MVVGAEALVPAQEAVQEDLVQLGLYGVQGGHFHQLMLVMLL
jgi:hypothetical protein